jgi:putative membrane protein
MTLAVLAQMWNGNHMGGGWWWAMGIGWLLFLALATTAVVLVVRSSSGRNSGLRGAAEDVLTERFARGEIDEDEYDRLRDVLSR